VQAALTGLVALLVYLATTGGSLATTDAVITYEVTENLLRDGSVHLKAGRMVDAHLLGPDGRYYSPFGIGQSIYNIPFYLAGDAAARWTGVTIGEPDMLRKAAVALGSAFAAAGCVWLTYLFAWRISGDTGAAKTTALSLAFASALWPYSKFGFNAPLTALCVVGGALGAWRGATEGRTAPLVWGGAFLGFAILTRHEMMAAAAAIVVWTAWCSLHESKQRAIAALAAGPVAAAVIWLVYNHLRFGNPLYAGHRPAFATSGFAGLLYSPGGSLFLYSPIAIVGAAALIRLFRYDRRTASLLGATSLVLFAFYGALDDWLGTRSYGPRYLVPLLPLLLVPLAPALTWGGRSWTSIVAVTGLAGLLVQVPGVMVDPGKVNVALGRPGPVTMEERRYEWELSALVLNARATARLAATNARHLTGREPRPHVARAAPGASMYDRLSFSLDFWWLYLFYLGVLPATAAVGAPAALLAAAWIVSGRLDSN
jgi:hypothetical protein